MGRQAIVAFPNFGHWTGAAVASHHRPRAAHPAFPYEWYESPNIHFLTVDDFILALPRAGLDD